MKKILTYAALTAALITGCKKSEIEPNRPNAVAYQIIPEASRVGWSGHTANETNEGSFDVGGDGLTVADGKVASGSFTIPIASLKVSNLEGELKNMLETHLKSADFFNIAIHPNAKFNIKSVTPYTGTISEGVIPGANYLVKGELTMLGKTKSIEFPAKITLGSSLVNVVAILKINRLDFGMTYASDPSKPEHYIYPNVDLALVLVAKK